MSTKLIIMKSKILMLFMMLIIAGLATITSCSDDDDDGLGICAGVYATENECKDAIKGADNCKCELENDLWIAVPD
jgi:hypothetical protein